ncbi:glycosyltransferase family 4 protein [Cellulomonas wangsupingiae]|uniref:Glycosyltransferase family 4 protein n=1 Tax=Cellulomonas wangsupingiae TaxID=2968085 RepID=A0ABY5K281_9CELL|nr:glycosyltransferase family 1 protein [Cellulomonas wangsupingiae]MCC2335674.1 glycosyltransferase family 4 protein [Cellulomonas wangsupingiae]UUI63909.1 glycosyltransferase family 4 protein [Cellulomonas wangsupingiae]
MTPLRACLTVEQLWQPQPGGSGRYVLELAAALRRRTDVEVTGVRARHGGPPEGTWAPPEDLAVVASRLPRPALYEAWARLRRPHTWRPAHPDVVHATTWAVPPRGPGLVVTVHDLAFLRDPTHFTPRGNAFFRRALEVVAREADEVVVVSEATRADAAAAGIDPERLHVVPHGVEVPQVAAATVAEVRERLGLTRPYVMWCGTIEPRKNVRTLLEAFAVVARSSDLDLLLIGPRGWGDPDLDRALRALPEGRVHLAGQVDSATLHAAYAGARAFCFPSVWEGFGMPVLEAMAHGVPVVTSAGTSMAEIAGADRALLVPPLDAAAMADAILEAAGPSHGRLATAGRAYAEQQTWDRCAEQTLAVYRRAAARR